MSKTMMLALSAATMTLAGCSTYGDPYDRGYSDNDYVLGPNDRIYRNADGTYYCRKPDGTTGLLVGGAVGGVLGNIIAPGGSELIGTIIGAGAGALLGREIERREVRCR